MLLSMFMSFLLARRFHGKVYVFLMAIVLTLTSFFSVGSPHYYSKVFPDRTESGILLENPLLLTFPFYASLCLERTIAFDHETYQLRFLTLMFQEYSVYSEGPRGTLSLDISWSIYILFISFFFLVNMVGAIIGYWISRKTFIRNLSKTQTSSKNSYTGCAPTWFVKEKWATACGWIGFGLILAGILLPWGTYSSIGVFFQTGLTSTFDLYLIAGSISVLIGLLGSLEKASGWPNVFLGGGGLITIIGAGGWISIYYGKPFGYPTIFALSVGPFVTIIGGVLAMLAAVLYALHKRTKELAF